MKRLLISFSVTITIGLMIYFSLALIKENDSEVKEDTIKQEEKNYEFDISYGEEININSMASTISEHENVIILLGEREKDATKKVSSLLGKVEKIDTIPIYYIEKENSNKTIYQNLINKYPTLSNYINFTPVILVFKNNELIGGLPGEVEEKNILNFLKYTEII